MQEVNHFFKPNIMLILSEACMAECNYCFGPHRGKIIDLKTVDKIVEYIKQLVSETGQKNIQIIFHGGEPLMAPYPVWEYILTQLSHILKNIKTRFSIQSNLWNLDDRFCELFRKFNVSIGSSLDGPECLNDSQRGKGYFKKNYKSIKLASQYGLNVGCIATFTPKNINHWDEIMEFFLDKKISFSIHPSVKPLLQKNDESLFINNTQYTFILEEITKKYIKERKNINIDSINQIVKAVALQKVSVCTFRDCLGMFLAINPIGDIYLCQRFCGINEYSVGNVSEMPSLFEIENHPIANKLKERQKKVKSNCGSCSHYNYCKGGCYYNALSNGDGIIDNFCQTYKTTFDYLKTKLIEEIKSGQNINAIKENTSLSDGHPFLKKGNLISLIQKPHPSEIAQNAKHIIALHELGKGSNFVGIANRMVEQGITKNAALTSESIKQIQNGILENDQNKNLNNIYIHLTFNCNLRCTHCYANAQPSNDSGFIEVGLLFKLIVEARKNSFRQIIFTGGEPLIHPQIYEILEGLTKIKRSDINFVLRTNLTGNYPDDLLQLISKAFHQVVVSVDGDEVNHNLRRGKGTYQIMKNNITRYQDLFGLNEKNAELSLACVLRSSDITGHIGKSVQELGNKLGIKRIRFRPLLPIGRAKDWDEPPASEALHSHLSPIEIIKNGYFPRTSCGLGQNIYIEPTGDSFPCYAYHKPHSILGNVFKNGLTKVIDSPEFLNLSKYNVDNIEKCKECEFRYLCGGACRAWSGEDCQYRIDAPPTECYNLKNRAKKIVKTAREYLLNDEFI